VAVYRRVYDSRHLQADCQEPGSAPGSQVWATFTFLLVGVSEMICKLGVANDGVVYATCDYRAKNTDELSFDKGQRLRVSRKGDGAESEWWWATVDTQHGYVPQNLLSVLA